MSATGFPSPFFDDFTFPGLAGLFCVGPTSSAALNVSAGLPGLGRLRDQVALELSKVVAPFCGDGRLDAGELRSARYRRLPRRSHVPDRLQLRPAGVRRDRRRCAPRHGRRRLRLRLDGHRAQSIPARRCATARDPGLQRQRLHRSSSGTPVGGAFVSPLPLAAGGVATCVVTRVRAPVTGACGCTTGLRRWRDVAVTLGCDVPATGRGGSQSASASATRHRQRRGEGRLLRRRRDPGVRRADVSAYQCAVRFGTGRCRAGGIECRRARSRPPRSTTSAPRRWARQVDCLSGAFAVGLIAARPGRPQSPQCVPRRRESLRKRRMRGAPIDGICSNQRFAQRRSGTGTGLRGHLPGAGTCVDVPRPCFGATIERTRHVRRRGRGARRRLLHAGDARGRHQHDGRTPAVPPRCPYRSRPPAARARSDRRGGRDLRVAIVDRCDDAQPRKKAARNVTAYYERLRAPANRKLFRVAPVGEKRAARPRSQPPAR